MKETHPVYAAKLSLSSIYLEYSYDLQTSFCTLYVAANSIMYAECANWIDESTFPSRETCGCLITHLKQPLRNHMRHKKKHDKNVTVFNLLGLN